MSQKVTTIRWRDAKAERPSGSGWHPVIHKSKGIIHAYWDFGDYVPFWSDGQNGYRGKITHFALSIDITTTEEEK